MPQMSHERAVKFMSDEILKDSQKVPGLVEHVINGLQGDSSQNYFLNLLYDYGTKAIMMTGEDFVTPSIPTFIAELIKSLTESSNASGSPAQE